MRYAHTNLVARDWRALSDFYVAVFGCRPLGPERDQGDAWLGRGVGVPGVRLKGVHLLLPGHGNDGPTLEIYTYHPAADAVLPLPHRPGLGHLSFQVADVAATLAHVVEAGGSELGEVTSTTVEGVGDLTFVYARDPEGNILELQRWGGASAP